MELFIIVEDTEGSVEGEPGTWVLGESEREVLRKAFWRPKPRKDYLIESETDHWHRFYELEYIRDFDGNIEERLDYYLGACASAAAYIENAWSLAELHLRILEADKRAREFGLDIKEYADFDDLRTYGSGAPRTSAKHRVWSWDRTHLLVGDDDDLPGWRIIPRI